MVLGRMKAQFPTEQSDAGEFQRQPDEFREWIRRDGSTAFKPEANRYHIYISLACPWASRTLIVRQLKGLEEVIGVTVVDPVRDDLGWAFRDLGSTQQWPPAHSFASTDPVNGFQYLSEA